MKPTIILETSYKDVGNMMWWGFGNAPKHHHPTERLYTPSVCEIPPLMQWQYIAEKSSIDLLRIGLYVVNDAYLYSKQ